MKSQKKYADISDLKIIRDGTSNSKKVNVFDAKQNLVFYSDNESWTDDQIWEALVLANDAFDMGCFLEKEKNKNKMVNDLC